MQSGFQDQLILLARRGERVRRLVHRNCEQAWTSEGSNFPRGATRGFEVSVDRDRACRRVRVFGASARKTLGEFFCLFPCLR